MSSNVKNGTQEEYPKDSFDRFGDDLCGLVLSYLSLKDSFRYECLSKQWMRTVFTNRSAIDVEEYSANEWEIYDKYPHKTKIDRKTIELVIKKCLNITSIE